MPEYWEQFEESPATPQDNGDYFQQFKEASEKGFLEKAADVAQKYVIDPVESARLPSIAGGFLQAPINAAQSVMDLLASPVRRITGKELPTPQIDLSQYLPQDPISRAAFGAGELGGSVLPYGAATKVATRLLKPKSIAGLMGTGAATGYALGKQPGSEDNLTDWGRIFGAGAGAVIPGVLASRPKKIASEIIDTGKEIKAAYSNKYRDIFSSLKNAGIEDKNLRIPADLTKPSKSLADLKTAGTAEFRKSLDVFKGKPTFENAHYAQSDLGKISREMDNQISRLRKAGKEVPASKVRAKNLADTLQKRLRGNMQSFLVDNDAENILGNYANTTKGYAKEAVPYSHRAIEKIKGKKLTTKNAKKMLQALNETEAFEEGIQTPIGFGTHKALSSELAKKLIAAGLTGGAIDLAYRTGLHPLAKIMQMAE